MSEKPNAAPVEHCPHRPTCLERCTIVDATDALLAAALDGMGESLPGTIGQTAERMVRAEIERRRVAERLASRDPGAS